MPIEIISKIAPKNDGFIGLVDAMHIIGDGATNVLPLNTIPSGVGLAISANGTPMTVEPILNFSTNFSLADNGGTTSTDVDLASNIIVTSLTFTGNTLGESFKAVEAQSSLWVGYWETGGWGAYPSAIGTGNTFLGWRVATDSAYTDSVIIGSGAGLGNKGATSVIIGAEAANSYSAASIEDTVLIGYRAGYGLYDSTGDIFENTFVGVKSGYNTTSTAGGWNTYLGAYAGYYNTTGTYNIAIGAESGPALGATAFNNTLCIGNGTSPTADNQAIIGGSYTSGNFYLTDFYLGQGITTLVPQGSVTIHASGSAGTNIAANDLILAGGASTGSGAAGTIVFQITPAGASGATPNVLKTAFEIDETGNIYIGDRTNQTITGKELRFVDQNNNYTGFKLLNNGARSQSYTYTLPDTYPDSTKFLQCTDAGIMSWASDLILNNGNFRDYMYVGENSLGPTAAGRIRFYQDPNSQIIAHSNEYFELKMGIEVAESLSYTLPAEPPGLDALVAPIAQSPYYILRSDAAGVMSWVSGPNIIVGDASKYICDGIASSVEVVNGDPTVTGSNTAFLTDVKAGDAITIYRTIVSNTAVTKHVYTVLSVTNDTELELTVPYAQGTVSGLVACVDNTLFEVKNSKNTDVLTIDSSSKISALTDLYLGANTRSSALKIVDSTGGTYSAGFKVTPGTLSSNSIYEMPAAFPGSSKVLQSTSAGVLSWVDGGGGGITWSVVTGATQAMTPDNGYIANHGTKTVFSLPTTCAAGKTLRVSGMNQATGWKITQAASQVIYFGNLTTTTGIAGYLESTAIRDSVELVCIVADLEFNVVSSMGNITIA